VFDSEKRLDVFQGIAENWNRTGWDEIYKEHSKFSVKSLTNSVMISPGKYKEKQS